MYLAKTMASPVCEEILSDLESLITCAICREQLTSPRLLPCQHSFCLHCLCILIEIHNRDSTDSDYVPRLSCPSCRRPTYLSQGGANMLPVDIKANQIAAIIKRHQKTENNTDKLASPSVKRGYVSSVFELSDSDSDLDADDNELGAVLQWCAMSSEHIWDVDFLYDGSVVSVNPRRLKRLSNIDGLELEITALLDTQVFHSPCAIAAHDDRVAIADWLKGNNEGSVTLFTRNDQSERRQAITINLPFHPDGVALVTSGGVVISGNNDVNDVDILQCYDDEGNEIWSKTYPTDTLGPYIAVNGDRQIFISTPTKNTIDVYNSNGDFLKMFTSTTIREPRGLCFNSSGHLIVADQSDRTVSAYDEHGNIMETLVKFCGLPNSIALYQDKFLTISDWQDRKLYLYELNR